MKIVHGWPMVGEEGFGEIILWRAAVCWGRGVLRCAMHRTPKTFAGGKSACASRGKEHSPLVVVKPTIERYSRLRDSYSNSCAASFFARSYARSCFQLTHVFNSCYHCFDSGEGFAFKYFNSWGAANGRKIAVHALVCPWLVGRLPWSETRLVSWSERLTYDGDKIRSPAIGLLNVVFPTDLLCIQYIQ